MNFYKLTFDKNGAPLLDGRLLRGVKSYNLKRDWEKNGGKKIASLTLELYVEPPEDQAAQEQGDH